MFRSFDDFQQRRPLISDFLIGFRPLNGEYKVYFGDVLDIATSSFIYTVTLSAQSIARSITGTQFYQSQSTYTTVNSNSARWYNTFLPISGGEVTGDLLIIGSLSALGSMTFIDTKVMVMSALSITNIGTGPALVVNQQGTQPIAEFQDDGTVALYIVDGGNVGIKTVSPGYELTINGTISSQSIFTNIIGVTGNLDVQGNQNTINGNILSGGINILTITTQIVSTVDVPLTYTTFKGISNSFIPYTNVNPFSADWNLRTNQVATLYLSAGGNTLLKNPTNQVPGGTYILMVETLSGNVQLFFDTAYRFPNSTAPTLTQGPSAMDIFTFISDGRYMYGTTVQNYNWV